MISELLPHLYAVFAWCMTTSLEASVVVLVILALQGIMGRRLSARWHYGLWLILLLRLVLPWTPASSLSVFNALPEVSMSAAEKPAATAPSQAAAPAVSMPAAREAAAPPVSPPLSSLSWREWLLLAWMAGAAVFLIQVFTSSWDLWRRVWHAPTLEHPQLRELLAESKRMLGVSTPVDLVALHDIHTPALLGFLRPRLVLPMDLPRRMSLEDLRFIFLHEMAHLKRNDILVNWLTTFLQALHWFNPVIWYAFHRMRSDRELACDARALECLQAEERQPYGLTVLRLFEQTQHMRRVPGMAGVAEDKSRLKRRITMIAFFGEATGQWTLVALVLLLVAAPFVFTRARTNSHATTPEGPIVDTIDYPFADDPQLLGAWKTVDFVKRIEDFNPARKSWSGDFWLHHFVFEPQGVIKDSFLTWTRGHVLNNQDMTDSAYVIKTLPSPDGQSKDYLFFQWKSGDYTIRHMEPQYYVLARADYREIGDEAMLGKTTELAATSTIAPNGRIVDKIDLPFVDDPAVLGRWESVDFVQEKEEFVPGGRRFQGDLYLKSLTFMPQGKMEGAPGQADGALTWTKGFLLHSGDKTASAYEIRNIGGQDYLYYEWKSGDYIIRHMKPEFYVLKRAQAGGLAQAGALTQPSPNAGPLQASAPPNAAAAPQAGAFWPEEYIEVPFVTDASGRRIDATVWQFEDDPYLPGHWTSVDFVQSKEQFQPGRKQWKGDLYLKDLQFFPEGRTAQPWWTWTLGLVVHSGDQTASHYFMRNMGGQDYLFFEWKSGDYTTRGMQPSYYVLRRDGQSILPR